MPSVVTKISSGLTAWPLERAGARSASTPTATAAAIATTMFSFRGSAYAATAAQAATTAATHVNGLRSCVQVNASRAIVPAKPRPQDEGMPWPATIPVMMESCHTPNVTSALPRK